MLRHTSYNMNDQFKSVMKLHKSLIEHSNYLSKYDCYYCNESQHRWNISIRACFLFFFFLIFVYVCMTYNLVKHKTKTEYIARQTCANDKYCCYDCVDFCLKVRRWLSTRMPIKITKKINSSQSTCTFS